MKKNDYRDQKGKDERKNNQLQDSSYNVDEMEDVPPVEPYEKNRIDTTNL